MIPAGTSATVEVPATSANLGPGFDSLGLALTWYDRSRVTVIDSGVEVNVEGEGADTVPRDATHLVISTIHEALADLGASAPGLRLDAVNTIPHGRGLGSSSAALVGGLLLAWGLARPDEPVDKVWLLREAERREGHADNVAPAVHGGFVITWSGALGDDVNSGRRARSSRVHPDVAALALVPQFEVLTRTARSVLPNQVPFSVAVSNASRAALLVHAMGEEPSLFPAATADRLHQDYRASLMPQTMGLVHKLRSGNFGAFVSGAGPTVLVLLDQAQWPRLRSVVNELISDGSFACHELRPGIGARILKTEPAANSKV